VEQSLSHTELTDPGLLLLSRTCRGLSELRLQGHGAVTDAGAAAALRCLAYLRVLDLRGCKGVGDATAQAAVRHCPSLEELRLFGCAALTDAGLRPLAGLKRLRLLDLYGCRALSVQAVVDTVRLLTEAGALKSVFVGGIPSVRQALASDTRELFATLNAAAAAVAAGQEPPPPQPPSVPEPHVQISALFPAGLEVKVY
jgi:hypothetical protein